MKKVLFLMLAMAATLSAGELQANIEALSDHTVTGVFALVGAYLVQQLHKYHLGWLDGIVYKAVTAVEQQAKAKIKTELGKKIDELGKLKTAMEYIEKDLMGVMRPLFPFLKTKIEILVESTVNQISATKA